MRKVVYHPYWGTLWTLGPFSFLVRTRDNTAAVELDLGFARLYYGMLQGRPSFEAERVNV